MGKAMMMKRIFKAKVNVKKIEGKTNKRMERWTQEGNIELES